MLIGYITTKDQQYDGCIFFFAKHSRVVGTQGQGKGVSRKGKFWSSLVLYQTNKTRVSMVRNDEGFNQP